ncbi:cation:dicarboxylase symporter family transporter, partial [Bacillus cereus]
RRFVSESVSVLFGFGVAAILERGRPDLQFFKGGADSMFYVTTQVMKFAQFGVFALIGVKVYTFCLDSLIPLVKYLIVVYVA